MYRRICARCGKEAKKLRNGLCEECYREVSRKFIKKRRNVKVCSICGRVLYENKIYTRDDLINKIKEEFGGDVKVCETHIEVLSDNVVIQIEFSEKQFICNECKRYLNPRSYNYKIQLRGEKTKVEQIAKELSNRFFPVNCKLLPEGIDLYFKLNRLEFKKLLKYLRAISSSIKISRKLVTYDKISSKKVYKVTVAVRL
jgi:NMD protein affecting ribosome stability and mRNA decay